MMTDKTIFKLINENATVNEICKTTSLSPKQLFYRINMLKIKGYEFQRKYYYDGEITYELVNKIIEEKKNETTIYTSPKDKQFKAILISDLHAGNSKETLNKLNDVYNFSVKKGFNIIFNIGDLIDGNSLWNQKPNEKLRIEKQISHLLQNYPYDKNIINFICLGNHDYDALVSEGISLHKILETKRHDLVSLGYGYGIINIKNDKIVLRHPIETISFKKLKNLSDSILLTGHSHRFKNKIEHNYGTYVPTLSKMGTCGEPEFPSFLTLLIKFKNGYFDKFYIERFMFIDDKIYKIAEIEQPIKRNIEIDNNIKNEEIRKKILKK